MEECRVYIIPKKMAVDELKRLIRLDIFFQRKKLRKDKQYDAGHVSNYSTQNNILYSGYIFCGLNN